MKNLISGTSCGLGRFLSKKLSSDIYLRNKGYDFSKNKKYENIIHCAFGRQFEGQSEDEYISYQINVAKNLLKFKHDKFIFLSSIDVKSQSLSWYAKAKIEVEKLIRNKSENFLIIRPGLLFGKGMRMNSLLKVAIEKNVNLTLTPSSNFYPIFYTDIEDLINNHLNGTYHVITDNSLTLEEVSTLYQTNPKWGSFTYKSPAIDSECQRFISKDMSLQKPLERIQEFIELSGWKLD